MMVEPITDTTMRIRPSVRSFIKGKSSEFFWDEARKITILKQVDEGEKLSIVWM